MLQFNVTVAFGLATVSLGLVALRLPTAAWVGFAVVAPWSSRLITSHGAPRFFDFLDFPLTVMALGSAVVAFRHARPARTLPRLHRAVVRSVAVAAVAVVLSWVTNPTEPQRVLAGLVFALQPLLLVVAMLLAPPSPAQQRRLLFVALGIVFVQIPFALVESRTAVGADDVKGTLLGAGAGHHVMVGTVFVGLFLLMRLRWPAFLVLMFGGLAVLVAVLADAKQVLFIAPVAFLALTIVRGPVVAGARRARRSALPLLLIVVTAIGLASYGATKTAFDFIDKTEQSGGGKVAVAKAIIVDTLGDPQHFAFGFGPGQTVSRFAFLNTDLLERRAGNPMDLLGLSTAKRAARYYEIAQSGPYIGQSSFTSPQSSVLGVLGDYGLVGVFSYFGAIAILIRALVRSGSRIAASAVAGWAIALPLGIVFDWLEQPPFTLYLALITGLALVEADEWNGRRHRHASHRARSSVDATRAPT